MLSRILKRAEMSGRVDDTTSIFRKRYAGHVQEIAAVISAFAGRVIDVRAGPCSKRNVFTYCD